MRSLQHRLFSDSRSRADGCYSRVVDLFQMGRSCCFGSTAVPTPAQEDTNRLRANRDPPTPRGSAPAKSLIGHHDKTAITTSRCSESYRISKKGLSAQPQMFAPLPCSKTMLIFNHMTESCAEPASIRERFAISTAFRRNQRYCLRSWSQLGYYGTSRSSTVANAVLRSRTAVGVV